MTHLLIRKSQDHVYGKLNYIGFASIEKLFERQNVSKTNVIVFEHLSEMSKHKTVSFIIQLVVWSANKIIFAVSVACCFSWLSSLFIKKQKNFAIYLPKWLLTWVMAIYSKVT